MIQPPISGPIVPPILNPVVTMPNTRPNAPGGDAARTSMSREGEIIPDTPVTRLVVRGWSAMIEELVLSWIADPGELSREQILDILAASLPAIVETLPEG